MTIPFPQAPKFVGVAFYKKFDGVHLALVGCHHHGQGGHIAFRLQAIDKGAEMKLAFTVHKMQRHGRRQDPIGGETVWIIRRYDFSKDGNEIGDDQDPDTEHRHLMLLKTPPHELPLRGSEEGLTSDFCRAS